MLWITVTYTLDLPRSFQVFLELLSTISQRLLSHMTWQNRPLLFNCLRQYTVMNVDWTKWLGQREVLAKIPLCQKKYFAWTLLNPSRFKVLLSWYQATDIVLWHIRQDWFATVWHCSLLSILFSYCLLWAQLITMRKQQWSYCKTEDERSKQWVYRADILYRSKIAKLCQFLPNPPYICYGITLEGCHHLAMRSMRAGLNMAQSCTIPQILRHATISEIEVKFGQKERIGVSSPGMAWLTSCHRTISVAWYQLHKTMNLLELSRVQAKCFFAKRDLG